MMENQRPKTIEELKAFCAEKGMPLEKMRFFIGEDYREPRAFGIYRDDEGHYVVYKNKRDGSRSIRYQGPDEAYAVKELYEKLRSEVELRMAQQPAVPSKKDRGKLIGMIVAACLAVATLVGVAVYTDLRNDRKGYYQYEEQTYYYDNHDWYFYDVSLRSWTLWDEEADWTEEPGDYYLSSKYSDDYRVDDFKNSEYYDASKDSSDWSSSYDYSNWDSGSTNWDSDW